MTPIKSMSTYLYYCTEQLVTSSSLTVNFISVKVMKIYFFMFYVTYEL